MKMPKMPSHKVAPRNPLPRLLRFLLAAIILPLFPHTLDAQVALAGEGKALHITVHPSAGEDLRFSASDLARILESMTGVRPEVRASETPEGIVIGTTAQFGVHQNDPALLIKNEYDGREAYIIRPDAKKSLVWILGNREDGASHGVYSLLREHGYRALFPGENWEVIPKVSKVVVTTPSEGRPKILTRSIWAGWGSFDKKQGLDVEIWRRRNRLGASISGQIGHSWESMIRRSPEAFTANPDLYGKKQDGSLNKASLRHGTKAVVDFTVGFLSKQSAAPNSADILSLAPTDGDNYTYDSETSSRGDVSDSFYWYVNEVARSLAKTSPGKLVGTTAYFKHAKPPAFDLEPNVIVLGATQFGSAGLTLEDFFATWSKKTKNLGIRDYIFSGYQFVGDHPDGGYRVDSLERQRQWLLNYPVVYYSAEGLWEWGVRGIGYYTLAQLLWDPTQNVDAVLKDFRESAYGAGAESMHDYYTAIEPRGKSVRNHQMAKGIASIQKAAKDAAADPEATARINDMKMYLVHVALLDEMHSLKKDDPNRWALAAADLEWNYRNRYTYILNYNCNRRMWMVNGKLLGNFFTRDRNTYTIPGDQKPANPAEQNAAVAKIFGPTWSMDKGFIIPHTEVAVKLTPPTSDEVREKFDKIVIPRYPAIEVNEVTYSTNYVPVDTGLKMDESEDAALVFGESSRWISWNAQPTSLRWNVTPNVRYRDRVGTKPLKITLERDGKSTLVQELVQNSQPQEATLALGNQGLNTMRFNTAGMGMMISGGPWEYVAMPTSPDTVVFLGTLPRDSVKPSKSVYFYVPKGVGEIEAFCELPFRVIKQATFTPFNGEAVKPVADGELIKITVPPGQDGKIWRVSGGGLGTRFYFMNLPNVLCFHPGKILVPRELAEKDGLTIVEK